MAYAVVRLELELGSPLNLDLLSIACTRSLAGDVSATRLQLVVTESVFVILRVAGNVVDDNSLGSMLYAIANLGSRAVMVMGHSQCGACTAAKGAFISAKSGQGDVASAGDPVSMLLARLMDPCAKLTGR